jgi:copper chaperone CopZ
MKIGDKVMYVGKTEYIYGKEGVILNLGSTRVKVKLDGYLQTVETHIDNIELIEQPVHESMTKREQFAMAAMQAYVNNYYSDKSIEHCAKTAIKMADELLKQLEV